MVEVEIDADPEAHADRPIAVENDETSFGENPGKSFNLGGAVEVDGVNRRETRELNGFEFLGPLGLKAYVVECHAAANDLTITQFYQQCLGHTLGSPHLATGEPGSADRDVGDVEPIH